jgi:hypothetical protein
MGPGVYMFSEAEPKLMADPNWPTRYFEYFVRSTHPDPKCLNWGG